MSNLLIPAVAALLWSSRAAVRGKWAAGAAVLGLTGLLLLGVSIAWDTGREWLLAAALLIAARLDQGPKIVTDEIGSKHTTSLADQAAQI